MTEAAAVPSPAGDDELIARFLDSGEVEPFEALVQRHQDRVFRLAASVLGPGSEGEAEEVAQEVLLTVYEKLGSFAGRSRFSTWLYRITYRTAVDRRRGLRHRTPHLGEEALAPLETPDADPEARAGAAERRRGVLAALGTLPDLYRTTVCLHYWMGLSVVEIGEVLDAPAGTVKSYLFRARQRLAEHLGREGDHHV